MTYKVFFVEDEVVIREGIRDSVDWAAHGLEYCGEAPDGEMALPLLQALNPDILITDIRMPFMDGLQLSQIVRDRLPNTKIIILSGHDEFEYAQQAIKLGVFEYLLKPISLQDLHDSLRKAASALDQENQERRVLQQLREQVELNRAALRERFLLKLVTGAATSAEAIERSDLLGLDLVARCYLVVAIKLEPIDRPGRLDYGEYQHIQQIISGIAEHNPDVCLLRKDMDELVLVMKGASPENLQEASRLFAEQAKQAVEQTRCDMIVGFGQPVNRISDISRSFLAATDNMEDIVDWRYGALGFEKENLLRLSRSAIEDHLRLGTAESTDSAIEAFVRPLGDRALRSSVVRSIVITDILLATARFIDELGGDPAEVIPELAALDSGLPVVENADRLREKAHALLRRALAFRDSRVRNQYTELIRLAQEHISHSFMDPELSLTSVAAQVGLSACHFSAVFSQETGHTFKAHLTETRINRAKQLLRTTTLRTSEIGYQVGYNDPHYFSHVFHKITGFTPTEFRAQTVIK
jgi:two-component system response regulator YesN